MEPHIHPKSRRSVRSVGTVHTCITSCRLSGPQGCSACALHPIVPNGSSSLVGDRLSSPLRPFQVPRVRRDPFVFVTQVNGKSVTGSLTITSVTKHEVAKLTPIDLSLQLWYDFLILSYTQYEKQLSIKRELGISSTLCQSRGNPTKRSLFR